MGRAVSASPGPEGAPGAAQQPGVRGRLLAEATRLFADRGYEGASVQEVVDAAGVTKGAMYHYFGSKDDLLYEIYARVLRMQMERLESVADTALPVQERLRAAAVDVVVTTVEHLDAMKVFFASMRRLGAEQQKRVRAERRRYHERFRAILEEGQAVGVFRGDIAPDLVVDYFFGAVHHLGTWYDPAKPLTASHVGENFAELLLAGLRPDPVAAP